MDISPIPHILFYIYFMITLPFPFIYFFAWLPAVVTYSPDQPTGTMITTMMMILQPLILMKDIPLDMIQIDTPEGSSLDLAKESNPVTIQNQHQPLNWTVSAWSAGYYFYSTSIRKSKGTSHCSINSKSFTVHRHNHSKSLLLSVEKAFTSVKAKYSPWFQQSPAASEAPSSLYKEAKTPVLSRSNWKSSNTSNLPSPVRRLNFTAEIP